MARLGYKRAFDLSLLLPTLLFFGLAIGAIALLLAVAEGRPVFFAQVRVGRGGRTFVSWKFRSMTRDRDPHRRVPTPIGDWMRRHGLDELPQIFNVLRGDMSLVGPRPLTRAEAERLAQEVPGVALRYELSPGLTGLAQVCRARGATLTAAVESDYARRASPALDLYILVRTLWINVVGKRRGACALPRDLG